MSATSEKIDYIIRSGIHSTLKQEGFLKSARTFRRVLTNCTQITNVQGSWTNYGGQGQFTINLAVYFPDAARLDGLSRITEHPLETDCIVNQRIGHLMPIQRDYWWKVDSTSNLDEITKDVVSAWLNYGKPWLENCSTPEGTMRFILLRKNPYWASVFSLMHGNHENAKLYLDEAISKASQSPDKFAYSRLQDWGRSQGLVA
jgi:hypothetical protein